MRRRRANDNVGVEALTGIALPSKRVLVPRATDAWLQVATLLSQLRYSLPLSLNQYSMRFTLFYELGNNPWTE
jgi:hypothetical protein